jgi:hypothetical protein
MASTLSRTPEEGTIGGTVDALFEHRVIQNTALATEALWTCATTCFAETDKAHGVALQATFLILPLVFHQATANAFSSKKRPGILPKVLAESRDLTIGLQARMEAMGPLTCQALNLGMASGCLLFDAEHEDGPEVLPGDSRPSSKHIDEDVVTLLSAARRLGIVFSEVSFPQLCAQLRVSF